MKNYLAIIFIILFELDVFPQHSDSTIKDIPLLIATHDNQDMKWKTPTIDNCCVLDSLRIYYEVVVKFRYPFAELDKKVIVDDVTLSKIVFLGLKRGTKRFLYRSDRYTFTLFQKYIWKICEDKLREWFKHQPYDKYYYSRDGLGKQVAFMRVLYITNTKTQEYEKNKQTWTSEPE